MDSSKPPPADNSLLILLLAAVCLISLSMLFSISESSFLAINKLRLRSKINRKDKRALRSGLLLKNKEKMLNSLLIANELVNILLSGILTSTALKLFGPAGVGIATFVSTILLLVFGEITPKAVSTRHPDSFAYRLSLFVKITVTILTPFVIIFTFFSRIILKKFFKIETKNENKSFSEEEIKTIIDVGGEEGVLEKSEHTMMHRVFKFTDLEAQSIMIPRTHIVALPVTASYRTVLEIAQRTHFSRFPIYQRDIDDIIGVLYVKDLLQYKNKINDFNIQNCMHEPILIPGTKNISYVQQQLIEAHQSLAIVIDEYSGTDGILTKEDIVSEIFGINPLNTAKSRSAQLLNKIETDHNCLIPGETRLIDLSETLHIPLNSEINETLGGWICEKLDHFPKQGEFVEYSGYIFIVEMVKAFRIETVRLQSLDQNINSEEKN